MQCVVIRAGEDSRLGASTIFAANLPSFDLDNFVFDAETVGEVSIFDVRFRRR